VREVVLVPVGPADEAVTEYLRLIVSEVLGLPARRAAASLPADFAYDPLRKQHHSTPILEKLVASEASGEAKILGVTDHDLMIPILTFVFGEAQLGGRAAIVSLARLRSSFYGLPEDPDLFYRRAEKEALHELGHTFGLVHCPDYECVMHFSNSVEEVDLKGDRYCARCAGIAGGEGAGKGAPEARA
jgi:archaemetzincin